MTAANKKFQQLKRKVQAIDAWKTSRDKKTAISDKFPSCRGSFHNCPTEEDLKAAMDKNFAPERCGRCPVFHDSGNPLPVPNRKMSPEEEELFRKAFRKK